MTENICLQSTLRRRRPCYSTPAWRDLPRGKSSRLWTHFSRRSEYLHSLWVSLCNNGMRILIAQFTLITVKSERINIGYIYMCEVSAPKISLLQGYDPVTS